MVVSLMETPRERFDDLYQQYFPKVYSYFSICFGADTAQDLSQITFLKVWDFLRQPHKKLPDHFRAWIFRVAVNVKNDYLRKKQRIPQQLEYEETYSGQGREMESQTVESLLVEQTLSKLHPGERTVVVQTCRTYLRRDRKDLRDFSVNSALQNVHSPYAFSKKS